MKKIQKILIGTHNSGKYREICSLLPPKIQKINPKTLRIISPKETGKTFLSNAILKAKYFSSKTNMTSISDDSGLQVKKLGLKPGIHSARWAKRLGGFQNGMKKILKLLKDTKKREAYFVCALCIAHPNGGIVSSLAKLKGTIAYKIRGNKGFGYDAIFIPNKKKFTFGQISRKKKLKIDHRYLAYKKLKKKINFL